MINTTDDLISKLNLDEIVGSFGNRGVDANEIVDAMQAVDEGLGLELKRAKWYRDQILDSKGDSHSPLSMASMGSMIFRGEPSASFIRIYAAKKAKEVAGAVETVVEPEKRIADPAPIQERIESVVVEGSPDARLEALVASIPRVVSRKVLINTMMEVDQIYGFSPLTRIQYENQTKIAKHSSKPIFTKEDIPLGHFDGREAATFLKVYVSKRQVGLGTKGTVQRALSEKIIGSQDGTPTGSPVRLVCEKKPSDGGLESLVGSLLEIVPRKEIFRCMDSIDTGLGLEPLDSTQKGNRLNIARNAMVPPIITRTPGRGLYYRDEAVAFLRYYHERRSRVPTGTANISQPNRVIDLRQGRKERAADYEPTSAKDTVDEPKVRIKPTKPKTIVKTIGQRGRPRNPESVSRHFIEDEGDHNLDEEKDIEDRTLEEFASEEYFELVEISANEFAKSRRYPVHLDYHGIVEDEERLVAFSTADYLASLPDDVEISSTELQHLMVLDDLVKGRGVCEGSFYWQRVGVGRHGPLRDQFVGKQRSSGFFFTPDEIRLFFDRYYDKKRDNMHERVSLSDTRRNLEDILRVKIKAPGESAGSGKHKPKKSRRVSEKDEEDTITYDIRSKVLSPEQAYRALTLGYEGKALVLATNLRLWLGYDCIFYKKKKINVGTPQEDLEGVPVRLFYSPELMQDAEDLRYCMEISFGEHAEEFLLYHAFDLMKMKVNAGNGKKPVSETEQEDRAEETEKPNGDETNKPKLKKFKPVVRALKLHPAWGTRRSVSGFNLVEFLETMMNGVYFWYPNDVNASAVRKDLARQSRLKTLDALVEHLRIKENTKPVKIGALEEEIAELAVITQESLGINPDRIREAIFDGEDTIGIRGAKKIITAYLDYSGCTDKRLHLANILGREGGSLDEVCARLGEFSLGGNRSEIRVNKVRLLGNLYSLVEEYYNFELEQAKSYVRTTLANAGIKVADHVIHSLLARTSPIGLVKFGKSKTSGRGYSQRRELISRTQNAPVEILFSRDNISDLIQKTYGDLKIGPMKPEEATAIFDAAYSRYTKRRMNRRIVYSALHGLMASDRYSGYTLPIRDVVLAAEIAILRYGFVDNQKDIPDINSVKRRYREMTGSELDTRGFLIRGREQVKYALEARSNGEQTLVQCGSLARLNPKLHKVARGLAETGEIRTYEVAVGGRTELCYDMGQLFRALDDQHLDIETLANIGDYVRQKAAVSLRPRAEQ